MQKLDIDAQSWSELNKLLDTALDLPPADRGVWLDKLGPEFDALKPRLRDLLSRSAGVETGDFLRTLPKIEAAVAENKPQVEDRTGAHVGPYRLLRELGQGGMGSVWLAERIDGLVNRPVALKLPHGAWRFAGLAERMAREREILATLNHPNIATLYDAGITPDGQPYLALEYVEGKPIDVYCAERSLDLRAKLMLFVQVANAVAHAHAKLVVHRDLKPTNILVTEAGQVRLLDFGIAKLLDENRAQGVQLTELVGRVLTPDYASPEQILGQPISIASDVYSLGVILYQLLTGNRPYQLKRDTRGALEDAILQVEPKRPSDAAPPKDGKSLRGDLDTIVLEALKKKPEERYATVNALVEDVFRFLDNRPVLAQPDSGLYRARKLLLRHRLIVSAIGIVALALVAGAGISIWQARVAIAEREYSEEVELFMTSIFRDASPYQQAGKRLTTVEILNLAATRVKSVSGDRPKLRAKMRVVLGSSLLALGELDAAEALAKDAQLDILGFADDDDRLRAESELLWVEIDRQRGRADSMRARLNGLLADIEAGANLPPEIKARALTYRAHAEIDSGDSSAAEADARRALQIVHAQIGTYNEAAVEAAFALAQSLQYHTTVGNEAIAAAEQAMAVAQRVYFDRPLHPRMVSARVILGNAYGEAGDSEKALEIIGEAVVNVRSVYGEKSQAVAFFLENLARYQRRAGRVRDALESAIESFEIQKEHAQLNSFNYQGALASRGNAYMAVYNFDAAAKDLAAAVSGFSTVFGETNGETLAVRRNYASALGSAGKCAAAREQIDEVVNATPKDGSNQPAIAWLIRAKIERLCGNFELAADQLVSTRRMIEGLKSPRSTDQANVAMELGLSYLEAGRLREARQELDAAQSLSIALRTQMTPVRAGVMLANARIDLAEGETERALQGFIEVDRFWRQFDESNRFAGEAAYWLGHGLDRTGRNADAGTAFTRARTILARSPFQSDHRLIEMIRIR